jgi:Domain of unknown function (DUF4253)
MQTLATILQHHGITSRLKLWFDTDYGAVYSLDNPNASEVAYWWKLRALVDKTGYWPVILTNLCWQYPDNLLLLSRDEPTENILKRGVKMVEEWPDYSTEWVEQRIGEMRSLRWQGVPEDEIYEDEGDPWEDDRPIEQSSYYGIGRPLLLVPTTECWRIPAIIGYVGGSCDQAWHVRFWKRWFDRYGVELVGLGFSEVQLNVAHLPTTRTEAMRLALEHDEYSSDSTEWPDLFAPQLLKTRDWYFWWD